MNGLLEKLRIGSKTATVLQVISHSAEIGGLGAFSRSSFRCPPVVRKPARIHYLYRSLLLVVVVGGISLGSLALVYGWVEPSGPGFLLYAFHDWVFLPVKGVLWTSIFPGGLLIWAPIILLVLVVMGDWATGLSPLRWAQMRLIHKLAYSSWGCFVLETSHRLAGGSHFRAQFMEEAVAILGRRLAWSARLEILTNGVASRPATLARVLCLKATISARYAEILEVPECAYAVLDALILLHAPTSSPRILIGKNEKKTHETLLQTLEHLLGRIEIGSFDARSLKRTWPEMRLGSWEIGAWLSYQYLALLRVERIRMDIEADVTALLRTQRNVLAALAADFERFGRPSGDNEFPQDDGLFDAWGLGLTLTAASAISCLMPTIAEETAFLIEEAERLCFAVEAQEKTVLGGSPEFTLRFRELIRLIPVEFYAAVVEATRRSQSPSREGIMATVIDVGGHPPNFDSRDTGDLWAFLGPLEGRNE